jgi:Ni/Co efflux regulator RcnB
MTKMFDVLTDEQWARLQKLIDNPPEHAKAYAKKLKEQMGESEKTGGAWQPGPNSWRPGDPIPEQYRQQREEQRTRQRPGFPRSESE